MQKPVEDIERYAETLAIRDRFPRQTPISIVETAVTLFRQARHEAERDALDKMTAHAATYINHVLYQTVFSRRGDMETWFRLADMPLEDLAAAGHALRQEWHDRQAGMTDEQLEREQEEEYARETELEQQERLEDTGFYGRTLPYLPACEDWIYIRFGRMPKDGRSIFGLAGEDTEDGPDAWRTESGNRTHESGVCVLRAVRHTAIPDAYIVLQPEFSLALYGVGDFESYLLAIIPQYEEGEHRTVLRIDGSPCTVRARDNTLRLELGSDGEYMIDTGKSHTILPLTMDQVWVSEKQSAADFLNQRRSRSFSL